MKICDTIAGFTVKEIHELSGLGAIMYVMKHERSGARLVYLDRDEENKTFSIAFKTLPTDSTGVFHILEHSVLCGSEKYRLKDPFVELLSGSLNTFLNAMTFADKTMYPVASTSEKEFLSLTDVYLDAVLNPLAVRDKKAFMQEGWHYEVDGDGGLSYKGVVLNEMRGDYSSPESVTDRHIHDMLFSGTPYGEDSGGDPSEITSLSYEQFCEAHASYYHPSNATVFLDGAMDLCGVLTLIDGYFSRYEKKEMSGEGFDLCLAEPKKERREVEYEIGEGEDTNDKTRLALAHLTFRFDEREKIFGAAILSSALFSSNESEIKRRVLDTGMCEDLQINVGEGIYENYFEVDFINVKDGRECELESFFYDTVAKICDRGIDREEILAAINSLEFSLRERDYGTIPLGIVYAMNLMETYLYSDDAVSGLTFEREIAFLRDSLEGDFFERLLSDMFLKNESKAALVMRPSHTLMERQRKEEEERLKKIRSELSASELEKIKTEADELVAWQNSEDSEEARAAIPRLLVSDISPEVKSIQVSHRGLLGAELVTHAIATNGISYTTLYFDVSDITPDEIFTAALAGLFLGNISTEHYSAAELVKTVKAELGSFTAALTPMSHRSGETKVYFKASASALTSKKKSLAALIGEILTRTLFTDKEAMKNIVRQAYIASEESFASAGHRAARSRAAAMLFSEAAVQEYYSGYEAHLRYKALSKSFESEYDSLVEKIKAFISKYLTRERLTLSLSEDSPESDNTGFAETVIEMLSTSGESICPHCNIEPFKAQREGIRIPAKVSYSSLCSRVEYDRPSELGVAMVASHFLSYEYLWSEIRVKGGAYGTGMSATRTGQAVFYSYRDPTPHRSVEAMLAAPDFLIETADSSERKIDKYIIGAIGESSPYLSPRARASIGTQRYLSGITDESRRALRGEILSLDKERLSSYAKRLKASLDSSAFCIVAPKDKLCESELDVVLEI